MCMSCVKQNMILNDHNTKSRDNERSSEEATEAVIPLDNNDSNNNDGIIINNDTKPELETGSSKLESPKSDQETTTHQSTMDSKTVEIPVQIKTNGEVRKRPVPNFPSLGLRETVEGKPNRFLLAPPNHIPDLPSDLASAKKMKRSFSFGGFSVFPSGASFGGMTSQELESMFDPVSKKEPSKLSKKQIKEYAQKYKHIKDTDKKLPWYKDPLEYMQPAHLVTCIAFVYLAFRLFPDSRRSAAEASTLTRLLYVSSVSSVFGAQFWMTFVSGLALFFSVPRHIFAKVQSVLFPLYFLTNAALMLVAIITYTQHRPTHLWDTHQLIQGCILVTGFFVNLGIRLYLAPILAKLITIKMAIETEAGMGSEVGSIQPGVLSRCPHYMRLHKAFRRTHIVIAIGNMVSMAGTSFHLYYLATKICSYDL